MTRILALDCGTLCGFAVSDSPISGVKDLKPSKTQRPGVRYKKLRSLLNSVSDLYPDLSLVVYEEPIPNHKGMAAAELAWGYVAVIKLWCADKNLPTRGIHISSWKKFVTTNGKASKEDVIYAVKLLGFNPIDNNHADALGILAYAIQLGKPNGGLI